jgi:hypothetical protein
MLLAPILVLLVSGQAGRGCPLARLRAHALLARFAEVVHGVFASMLDLGGVLT